MKSMLLDRELNCLSSTHDALPTLGATCVTRWRKKQRTVTTTGWGQCEGELISGVEYFTWNHTERRLQGEVAEKRREKKCSLTTIRVYLLSWEMRGDFCVWLYSHSRQDSLHCAMSRLYITHYKTHTDSFVMLLILLFFTPRDTHVQWDTWSEVKLRENANFSHSWSFTHNFFPFFFSSCYRLSFVIESDHCFDVLFTVDWFNWWVIAAMTIDGDWRGDERWVFTCNDMWSKGQRRWEWMKERQVKMQVYRGSGEEEERKSWNVIHVAVVKVVSARWSRWITILKHFGGGGGGSDRLTTVDSEEERARERVSQQLARNTPPTAFGKSSYRS